MDIRPPEVTEETMSRERFWRRNSLAAARDWSEDVTIWPDAESQWQVVNKVALWVMSVKRIRKFRICLGGCELAPPPVVQWSDKPRVQGIEELAKRTALNPRIIT